jgi:hypothetical protein
MTLLQTPEELELDLYQTSQQQQQEEEELEQEDLQTAIDPITGEINWDCPCLKGALEPPCGSVFKEAFSCFVASQTEPKGEDCLEKFLALQECFRAHPEKYAPKADEEDEETQEEPNEVHE